MAKSSESIVELYAQKHGQAYTEARRLAQSPPWSKERALQLIAESLRSHMSELIGQRWTLIEPRDSNTLDVSINEHCIVIDIRMRVPNSHKHSPFVHDRLSMALPGKDSAFAGLIDKVAYKIQGAEKYVDKKVRLIMGELATMEGKACFEYGIEPAPGLAAIQAKLALDESAKQAKPAAAKRPGL